MFKFIPYTGQYNEEIEQLLLGKKRYTERFDTEVLIEYCKSRIKSYDKQIQYLMSFIIYHQMEFDPKDWPETGWDTAPTDPTYYMRNPEDVHGEEDVVGSSYDWHIMLYGHDNVKPPESASLKIVDFHGWPGDNEIGAVVAFKGSEAFVLATNSDGSLRVAHKSLYKTMENYTELRESIIYPEYDEDYIPGHGPDKKPEGPCPGTTSDKEQEV